MRADITVVLRRDDGVTVSRETTVATSPYGRHESKTAFARRVRRAATSSLNAVLGVREGVEVTHG